MPPITGQSSDPTIPGVFGENTAAGDGVFGAGGKSGRGVVGVSDEHTGVEGTTASGTAVFGNATGGGTGVFGGSEGGHGIVGKSDVLPGVTAESDRDTALIATTNAGEETAFIINQWGRGNIMIGRDGNNAEVFRVLVTGDVESRGITLTCDVSVKTNFSDVAPCDILEKLSHLTLRSWNYKTDPPNVRHIGPTSQDFLATFSLNGGDDIHISAVDALGVAFAAIQGLNEKLTSQNSQLQAKLAMLESRIEALATAHR